jgi:hypothetical protein
MTVMMAGAGMLSLGQVLRVYLMEASARRDCQRRPSLTRWPPLGRSQAVP